MQKLIRYFDNLFRSLIGTCFQLTIKFLVLFGLFCGVTYLAVLVYEATPEQLRTKEAWNVFAKANRGRFCNATPVTLSVRIAYPVHSLDYGADFLGSFTREKEFEQIKTHGIKDYISGIYQKTLLNIAYDYEKLALLPSKKIAAGDCVTVEAAFRPGRERFFFRATVEGRFAETAFKKIALQNNVVETEMDRELALSGTGTEWPTYKSAEAQHYEIPAKVAGVAAYERADHTNAFPPHCSRILSNKDSWKAPIRPESAHRFENIPNSKYGDISIGFQCMQKVDQNDFLTVFELPYFEAFKNKDHFDTNALNSQLAFMKELAPRVKKYARKLAKFERIQQKYREELRTAQADQNAFETKWNNKTFPFVLGSLNDSNGEERKGVQLVELPSIDLFGSEQHIPRGAEIVAVNGRIVFSISNILSAVHDHATSFDAGIEKQIVVDYVHEGRLSRTPVRYFYNKHYYGSNHSGTAMYHGLLDATLYDSAIATCVGGNALKLGGNVGVELLGWAISGFDEDYTPTFDTFTYHDVDLCEWNRNQEKALAKQFDGDLYANMIYPAMLTPGGWRALGGKSLRKGMKKNLHLGALARPLANGTLEALETMSFDLATAPPEAPMIQRLKNSVKPAALGFTVGTTGSLIFPGGKSKKK